MLPGGEGSLLWLAVGQELFPRMTRRQRCVRRTPSPLRSSQWCAL
nr:hypothetical protein JVH1_3264 [Rhodococcus sp. JVH1]